MTQRAGERATEIGDADPLGAAIGADTDPDDRALAIGIDGGVGQRLMGRQIDDAGADRGDFHRRPFRGIVTAEVRAEETGEMKSPPDPHSRHPFATQILSHAVWPNPGHCHGN
jgi:hypothetical protein